MLVIDLIVLKCIILQKFKINETKCRKTTFSKTICTVYIFILSLNPIFFFYSYLFHSDIHDNAEKKICFIATLIFSSTFLLNFSWNKKNAIIMQVIIIGNNFTKLTENFNTTLVFPSRNANLVGKYVCLQSHCWIVYESREDNRRLLAPVCRCWWLYTT